LPWRNRTCLILSIITRKSLYSGSTSEPKLYLLVSCFWKDLIVAWFHLQWGVGIWTLWIICSNGAQWTLLWWNY
jgi:hypothetical protein